jgi:hypothetical protein
MDSVLNEFENGPVQGLQPIAMRDPNFLKLTPSEQVILVNWVNSPAYAVFLKLFEGEIEKSETAHFRVWQDEAAFQRTGIFAVAMRIGLERVTAEVHRQVEEFSGELEFLKKKKEVAAKSPEQQILEEFGQ